MNKERSIGNCDILRALGAVFLVALLSFPLGLQDLITPHCDHEHHHQSGAESDTQLVETCEDCLIIAVQQLPFITPSATAELPEELSIILSPEYAWYTVVYAGGQHEVPSRGPPVFTLI